MSHYMDQFLMTIITQMKSFTSKTYNHIVTQISQMNKATQVYQHIPYNRSQDTINNLLSQYIASHCHSYIHKYIFSYILSCFDLFWQGSIFPKVTWRRWNHSSTFSSYSVTSTKRFYFSLWIFWKLEDSVGIIIYHALRYTYLVTSKSGNFH